MSEIISAAVLLILIMDPLGNLPIFMSVLKHTEPKRRRAIMIRELLIALLVMFIFLFAGEKILAFLNLRAETVSISGGIILFLIAIKMIFPSAEGSSSGLPAGEEPFIVPLAIPLVAGPTILATLMLLSHQYPNQMSHLVSALLIAWGGTFIILLQSSLFLRLLGEKGVNALERLMGAHSGHDGNADVPGWDQGVDEGMTFSLSLWERPYSCRVAASPYPAYNGSSPVGRVSVSATRLFSQWQDAFICTQPARCFQHTAIQPN